MTYRESLFATLLIVFSALAGLAIVEIGSYIFLPSWNPILFFDGPDSIFRNVGRIFTYVPNSDIFSRTIYFSGSSYSTEYEYKFKTNNFGLVQDRDLVRGIKSIRLGLV